MGKDMLVVSREALRALSRGGVRRHQPLSAAGPSEAAAQHPRRQGSQRQRQVRRLRLPEERQHRRRRRAADVPGHRHRDHHGQEGLQRHHRWRRRGGAAPKARATPICAATCAIRRWRRCRCIEEKNTANNMPAQCEIYAEGDDAYKFMFMAKGGGSRQQELSVPGDAVGADQGSPAGVPEGEGADARHRGVPALSSGDRDRRHLGRALHEDGEARVRALSRCAADPRLGRRQRLPRSGDGAGNPEDDAVARRRRAVRRQVFLPRRARDPDAAPRRVAADRARRVLLGRPPGARQDHQGRRLSRRARA